MDTGQETLSPERFRNAFIAMDQRGVITKWDDQAEKIFGWTSQEAEGRSLCDLIVEPSYCDAYTHDSTKFLKEYSTKALTLEVDAVDCAKQTFPVEILVTALPTKERAFTVMVRDISPLIESEQVKGLLAAIVESSEDAIVTILPDGTITSWNESAEGLFGYSRAEALGRNHAMLIPDGMEEVEREVMTRVLRGERIKHYETIYCCKNKQSVDTNITMSPVRNTAGDITGISKIMQDITDRKIAEADWDKYLKELETSNRDLEEFSHLASHDLKEPLRGLSMLSSFLLEDNEGKLDVASINKLKKLIFLSQRMESLVSNMLYYSKLGNEQFGRGTADPNDMVNEISQMMEVTLSEKSARIIIRQHLPPITGDKSRIREVFRNLITNAVKYNDNPKPVIEVGFLNEKLSPSGIQKNVYYVKDNGIGIDPMFHQTIFSMFKRLPATGKNGEAQEGSGVGLAFVKKIIERHMGHIWLESELNKGSVFYFNFEQ